MTHKVAAVQMVSTGDVETNLESAARLIGAAKSEGAELVLLPEVFAVLEGGPMLPYAENQGTGPIQEFLSDQARLNDLIIVGGTIPLITRPANAIGESETIDDGRVRPACLVYDSNGDVLARYDKMHLFDVSVADAQSRYSESRSYEAGDEIVCVDTPVGRLGLSVCYDLRFPEFYRELFRLQADIVTVPAAFTKVTGEAHWETLLRARAIENQCYVIAAGQGGKHSERRETWGHSMIIDPWGSVLDMIEIGEGIAIADIDLDYLSNVRKRMPIADQQKLLAEFSGKIAGQE